MIKFLNKKYKKGEIASPIIEKKPDVPKRAQVKEVSKTGKNKSKKKSEIMNEDKMNRAEEIVSNLVDNGHVKIVKKDRGLIERTESSKVVLTEDNRQVLGD